MAVTCARCGTQNPDGNQFCQACGTPLTAAAIQPAAPPSFLPGPPAAPPPAPPGPPAFPPPPPPGYQSPYYAPSGVGPQPPVHRTPWTLIFQRLLSALLFSLLWLASLDPHNRPAIAQRRRGETIR